MEHRVSVRLRAGTLQALRGRTSFSTFLSSWLTPDTDRWVLMTDGGATVGGSCPQRVEELARRFREADEFLSAHGMECFDSGQAADLLPQVRDESDAHLRALGYSRLPSGGRVMEVDLSPDTAGLLRGPLAWFLAMAEAIGVSLRIEPGRAILSGTLWDDEVRIAGELRRLEARGRPDVLSLGTVEFLLPATEESGWVFRERVRELLEEAARTRDWRKANEAFHWAGLGTRLRVDPATGRARKGLHGVE